MSKLFLNPALPDYFVSADEVDSVGKARSFVPEYEGGKVVVFPRLKLGVDHNFWSKVGTGKIGALKKFSVELNADDEVHRSFDGSEEKMVASGVQRATAYELIQQMSALCERVIPFYRQIFGDYTFDRHQIVWRLNTIRAENMHVDTYKDEKKLHFARMFVNLDSQPRIWQTSWTIHEMLDRAKAIIAPNELEGLSRGEIWTKVNKTLFGKTSKQWWDNEPRHIAFFDPGDVWLVDSRQVSHQIFYGRRALSIDFTVPRERMLNKDVHYLNIVDRFMSEMAPTA